VDLHSVVLRVDVVARAKVVAVETAADADPALAGAQNVNHANLNRRFLNLFALLA
jgi:hypothetical protein